jgi:hypothetical protein
MPARKDSGVKALDVEGTLRHPDITGFMGTTRGRVMCTEPGCKMSGRPEEIWVIEHLAGHPWPCPEDECDRVFTREPMLNRHMRAHGKLYDEIPGESERERHLRMRLKRREALVEVGLTDAA